MYGFYNRLVVHPTFDYLLYPTANGLWTGDLVLWDSNAEREISKLFGIYTHTTVPKWSPDGEYFVSAAKPYAFDYTDRLWFDSPISMGDGLLYWGGFELIRMNLEGEKERLTYVTTAGPSDFFHYTWSPDGKKIATWLNINSSDDGPPFGGRLVVLDIETGVLTGYCIRGHYPIYWSPDGNYVVISKTEDETYRADHTNVAIVNLRDGWAVRLSDERSEAGGWMINEP